MRSTSSTSWYRGPAGAPDVPVRVYTPRELGAPCPGIVYFHSGGWVLGSMDAERVPAASAALDVGAVVVSVEYRLAPENPYPAAVDDCYAALEWTGRRCRPARGGPRPGGGDGHQRRRRVGRGGRADVP